MLLKQHISALHKNIRLTSTYRYTLPVRSSAVKREIFGGQILGIGKNQLFGAMKIRKSLKNRGHLSFAPAMRGSIRSRFILGVAL